MKIHHNTNALQVHKPEGTNVTYFLFPEYEVHYNEQVPHSIQTWHHHEAIWETLYMIDGELVAKWKEDGLEKTEVVHKGDLVETERTPHTFSNETDEIVRFIVIKQLLTGKDHHVMLKTDKVIDQ